MTPRMLLLTIIACLILTCHGFFKPKTYKEISTHVPQTLDELRDLLCTKKNIMFMEGSCDSEPKKIIINKVFDFTNYQGTNTEAGCRYDAFGGSCPDGLWRLKTSGGCGDKTIVNVEYSAAGMNGLEVGSNKIIVGVNGGGLKGKGLKLYKSFDVQIRNLAFTDINPHLYYGGSAIELIGANNVLIDGNYFKNIGHVMVGSHSGSTTGVTISKNLFDGNRTNSFHCDGTHSPIWWFAGETERIRIKHNIVHHASGDAPKVSAQKNTKTFVHMFRNVFYNVRHSGAIRITEEQSSVLAEGNVFTDVTALVDSENRGNVFIPQTDTEEVWCDIYIKRRCEVNTVVNVKSDLPANSIQVLRDAELIYEASLSWFSWIFGPSY